MTASTFEDTAPAHSSGGRPETSGPMSHRQVLEAMSGLMLALLVAILSSTIVSNALPRIIADLDGDQGQYTWVVTAMLLTSTASTPIWGKLSDLFSKKLLYQLAITIFTVGSVLGGFAETVPVLIGFRAVQGIGMGGLQALIQVVIAAMVSPRDRGRYSGYIGATFAVATVSGPLVGGLIVDTPWLGWRWCFWVTVPIAVIAFIVLGRTLKLPVLKREVHIDWFGAFFLVGGVSLLLIWVSMAGKQFDWMSPETLGLVGGGTVALIVALIIEARVREPIVPLTMFRNPTVTLATIATVAVGTAMFGGSVFLGQYFQIARSFTPTEAGLMTLPMVGGLFVSSTLSGQIVSRYTGKIKPFLLFGSVVLVAGMGLLSTINHETNLVLVEVYLALMGIGVGSLMQNLVLAVQNSVGSRDMGSVTSVVTFFRTLGGSAGVSVLGAVLATQVTSYVTAAMPQPPGASAGDGAAGSGSLDIASLPARVQTIVREAYGDAIGDLFYISALISIVTLVAVLFLKEAPLRTTIESKEEREEAVDNAPELVDNSTDANRRSPRLIGASPQVESTSESYAHHLGGPVDNSVNNRFDGWSDPISGHPALPHAPNGVAPVTAMITDRGERLYGTTHDSSGAPVPNAVLTLTDVGGRQIERARTDASGGYRLSAAAGTYLLIATAPRFQPSASRVVIDDEPTRYDIRLFGSGGLTGVVRAEGAEVPGAAVVLTDSRGEVITSCVTGVHGRYQFADLVGGTYALTVTADGHRPVSVPGEVVDGELSTVDVALNTGARLSGVVRDEVGPIPRARVSLLDAEGEVVDTATTGADGAYRFADLPLGQYTVIATGYPPVAATLRVVSQQVEQDVELGYPED